MKKILCFHKYKKRNYVETVFEYDCFMEGWQEECIICGKRRRALIYIPAMCYRATITYHEDGYDGIYLKDGIQINF